jgi:hypothetical protein
VIQPYEIQARNRPGAKYPFAGYPEWRKPERMTGDFDCPDRGAACLLRNAHAHANPQYDWRVINTQTGERIDDFQV